MATNILKFRAPDATDKVYLTDKYFTNGHWLVSINWLEGLTSLQAKPLQAALVKARIKTVTDQMSGGSVNKDALQRTDQLISSVNLKDYSRYELGLLDYRANIALTFSSKRKRDNALRLTGVDISVGYIRHPLVRVDSNYLPLLDLDHETEIAFKTKDAHVSPIAIIKNEVIVALLMPINHNPKTE